MSDTMEIIISAVDSASEVFQSIIGSVTSMGDSIRDVIGMASSDFDSMAENVSGFQDAVSDIDSSSIEDLAEELGLSTDEVERLIDVGASLGSIPFNDAAASADELEQEITEADDALGGLNDDLGLINSSMLMSLGSEVGKLGDSAEGMAQDMNTAAISVGQLATNAGVAEPQMISLINNISNATFPQAEAMAYSQALTQMGVSFDSLGSSATNMDRINDATGIGYDKVIKLTQGLQSMGITADNLPSSFNAIAFAQANVTGGADTLQRTLMRQASTINEYGLNVDQVVLIMQKLSETGVSTTKMGTALSEVLKENNGDISAIEQSLGMANGTLSDASAVTGQYEGQLQSLADEEMQHKTILDQIGAAWEDVSLSIGQFMTPFLSVVGLIGQIGSFGLQVKGLRELISLTKSLTEVEIIDSAVKSGKAAIMSVVTAATTLYGIAVGVLTGEIGLATAATLAFNAVLAMNPVALAVIAIAALVAVVYEVGKAFGWWTDVSSMIDAVWSGIQRLWSAFINHPDVQAAITAISEAWNILVEAVGAAWEAITEFFNLNESGSFDVVHELIMAIGAAWDFISIPIKTVIGIVQGVINIFNLFSSGQMTLPGLIGLVWNQLSTLFMMYLTMIVNNVVAWGAQIVSKAISSATSFVSNIITHIKQLPGKIYTSLIVVVSRIQTAITLWKNKARAMVTELISNVVSVFTSLPGKISSALSGVVEAVTAPFRNAWDAVKPYVDQLKEAANIIPGFNSAGGEGFAGGEIGTLSYTSSGSESLDVNYNISLDLSGVPAGMSAEQLISVLTDRSVLSALTGNRDFQVLDARVKSRIKGKQMRARGV